MVKGEGLKDCALHELGVLTDLVVREPQDREAGSMEPGFPVGVVFREPLVDRAVGFDHERSTGTQEVHDEAPDCGLPAELPPAEPFPAQELP